MEKRLVALLGILGTIGAAVVLSSCPATTAGQPPPQQNVTTLEFVGSEVCRRCHSEIYQEWSQTHHAGALASLAAIGQDTNAACLQCHTVGWAYQQQNRQAGFTDMATTPHLANVQCENCHGPGREHVEDPGGHLMVKALDAELCGTCHTDAHHPTIDEWRTSAHAVALTTIAENPHGADTCLNCHSVDRFLSNPLPIRPTLEAEARNIFEPAAEAQFAITCVLCHDPHSPQHEHQLREAVQDVCIVCHTHGGSTPGRTPHHAQREMFLGVSGVDAQGNEMVGPNSSHTSAVTERCVTCHLGSVEVEQPTDENPNFTGHTFRPDRLDVCLPCHTAEGADQRRFATQTAIQARIDQVQALLSGINRSALSPENQTRYDRAKFDLGLVNADASRGVHNRAYADTLLNTGEAILQAL